MRTIHKFVLVPGNETRIKLPRSAKVLAVQVQYGNPQVWVELDTAIQGDWETRSFFVFGTGHQIPDHFQGQYVGTFQLDNGELVFHVYAS